MYEISNKKQDLVIVLVEEGRSNYEGFLLATPTETRDFPVFNTIGTESTRTVVRKEEEPQQPNPRYYYGKPAPQYPPVEPIAAPLAPIDHKTIPKK